MQMIGTSFGDLGRLLFVVKNQKVTLKTLAVFILEDALSVWMNLGKHLLFVWLFVPSIKTGTRRIIRLGGLSSFVRLI